MDLSKLTKGDRIVVAGAILLVLDLLLLPWLSYSIPGILTVSVKGVDAPDSLLGVLALVIALAMGAQIVLARMSEVKLPEIGMPWGQAHFFGGVATLVLLGLKFILHTSHLAIGAYLGLIFAIVLTVGAVAVRKESTTAGTAG
ncbi:MAG TPA: hypothetical protein VFW71_13545 [Actinomycetota bacterium]|nr:hypothetical protein [Actinomycetota bacterium]